MILQVLEAFARSNSRDSLGYNSSAKRRQICPLWESTLFINRILKHR